MKHLRILNATCSSFRDCSVLLSSAELGTRMDVGMELEVVSSILVVLAYTTLW